MKHYLVKLVLFLLLGAIVNVAVAWACSCNRPVFDQEMKVSSDQSLLSPYFDRFDVLGSNDFIVYESESFGCLKRYADSDLSPLRAKGYPQLVIVEIVQAGWPLYCLEGEGHYLDFGNFYFGALRKPWRNQANQIFVGSEFLPLRPLWTGLIINTLFYAVILWIVWPVPFFARRLIRRRRGRCIKCGYDLRGTSGGCPECGWQRQAETLN